MPATAATIEFAIGTDSNVEIGELGLYGLSVNLSGGTTITELSIGQEATIIANCDDSLPPGPFRLCGSYLVPAGPEPGFKASSFCKVDGDPLEVVLENSQPIPLTVDFTTMTFAMSGGPIEGDFSINGDPYTARVSIDITGPFTSLAPVAGIAETETYWECGDSGTADVFLSASTSDDELGGSIVAYKWIEDRGSLDEKTLATTCDHTETMGFGVHHLSLLVEDNDGIWNSLDFELEVGDSKIDVVDPPPDVWAQLPIGAGGASVNIGQASGSDICSGAVDITSNANSSGWYPKGLSVVEYRFDDCNGNVVYHQQKIFVTEVAYYPPPISEVFVTKGQVQYGQTQQIIHETYSQGKAILADEYVVVRGPEGLVASVNDVGDLVLGQVEPRARDTVFGAGSTSVVVFNRVLSDFVDREGDYVVETSLVIPGAPPEDPESVLGRAWAGFLYTP
jgi:hypothetical protein